MTTTPPLQLGRAYPILNRREMRDAMNAESGPSELEIVLDRIRRAREMWSKRKADRRRAKDAADFLELDQAHEKWLHPNEGETRESMERRKQLITVDVAKKLLRDVATTYQAAPRRTVVLPKDDVADRGDTQTPPPDQIGAEPEDVADPLSQRDGETGQAAQAASTETDEAGSADSTPEARRQRTQDLNTWLDEHLWSFGEYGWDPVLQESDRWQPWHGTLFGVPRYVPDYESTGVDGVELLFKRRHEFEVAESEDDPRKADCVIFPIRRVVRYPGTPKEKTCEIFHYYDDKVFCRLVDWAPEAPVGAEDNPRWQGDLFVHDLGYIPVVPFKYTLTQTCFYSPPCYPNLKRMAQNINKLETELAYTAKLSGGVYYTDGEMKNPVLGADVVVQGTQGQQFSQVSSGAPLDAIAANIQRQMDNLAMTFGAPPGSFVMDPAAAKSGIAIQLEQSASEAIRRERAPAWEKIEARLNRAALDVYRVWGGDDAIAGMPEEFRDPTSQPDITVRHMPPPTQLSDKERREKLEWERKNKLISREDMLRESRPDLTEDEITARLERADNDNTLSSSSEAPSQGQRGPLFGGLAAAVRRPISQIASEAEGGAPIDQRGGSTR